MADGTYRDIAHPISRAFRAQIENKALHSYAKELIKLYKDVFHEDLPDISNHTQE